MQLIAHLLEQLHGDNVFGGGGSSLEMINRPKRCDCCITPNRKEVFKKFNYQFKV